MSTVPPTPNTRPAGRLSSQIGQVLLGRGLLTDVQLAEASQRPGALEQAVVELGFVTKADVVAAAAAVANVPFVTVMAAMVQSDALGCLPADFCNKHNVLPMMLADQWLTVAVEDFRSVFLLEELKHRSGRQVQVLAAEGDNIREVRQQVMAAQPGGAAREASPAESAGDEADEAELSILTVSSRGAETEEDSQDLEAAASGSPIIRLVNRVIKTAVEWKASDIHIEPEDKEVRVRYRVDGDLVTDRVRAPLRLLPAIVSRIKIMAGMDISQRRLPQDGGITAALSRQPIELRVSTMATPLGEKVVLRVMDTTSGQRRLQDLGLSGPLLESFRRAISQPNGIVLVTGPTGSGKTTTLYSALAELSNDTLNISSVEDPVELRLKGINQFQVNPKAGFSFPQALRSLLRQDPDVIMVGEIRDAETARLATEAALTGHLVLSTLHTNDAPGALPRLINMGVESYLVAAAVRAVLAQRLVRRLCPHCAVERPLSDAMKRVVSELEGIEPVAAAYFGTGCGRCRNSGFAGRVGIHELLVADEEMLTLAGRELRMNDVRKLARERGFTTMLHDAIEKVRGGVVGIESLFEVIGTSGVESVYADNYRAGAPAAA